MAKKKPTKPKKSTKTTAEKVATKETIKRLSKKNPNGHC